MSKNGADWLEDVNIRDAVGIFAEPRVQQRPRPFHRHQLAPYCFELVRCNLRRKRPIAVLLPEKCLRPQNLCNRLSSRVSAKGHTVLVTIYRPTSLFARKAAATSERSTKHTTTKTKTNKQKRKNYAQIGRIVNSVTTFIHQRTLKTSVNQR